MKVIATVLIAFSLSLCTSSALGSDWVDGNVNQFQVQTNQNTPKPRQYSKNSIDLSPSTTSSGYQYGNAIGVTDPGAGEYKSSNAIPLEANVSREQPFIDTHENGLGQQAATLMSQSPRLAPPTTQSVGPKVFHSWITNTHPNLSLENRKAIVEIKGEWDNAGHALHSFGLPSTKVGTGKELELALTSASVLVVNCAGDVPEETLPIIRDFVYNGGYLITTDWALNGCLSRAIPGYVEWNGGYSGDELVDATEVENIPKLITGTVPFAFWKLDNKCETVKVMKPNAVHVLVRSNQLAAEDPDGLGILAFTFRYGKGCVLHLVGHFDNNTNLAFNNSLPDPAPKIQISLRQAIAANFVVQALREHKEVDSE